MDKKASRRKANIPKKCRHNYNVINWMKIRNMYNIPIRHKGTSPNFLEGALHKGCHLSRELIWNSYGIVCVIYFTRK